MASAYGSGATYHNFNKPITTVKYGAHGSKATIAGTQKSGMVGRTVHSVNSDMPGSNTVRGGMSSNVHAFANAAIPDSRLHSTTASHGSINTAKRVMEKGKKGGSSGARAALKSMSLSKKMAAGGLLGGLALGGGYVAARRPHHNQQQYQ